MKLHVIRDRKILLVASLFIWLLFALVYSLCVGLVAIWSLVLRKILRLGVLELFLSRLRQHVTQVGASSHPGVGHALGEVLWYLFDLVVKRIACVRQPRLIDEY